MLMSSLVDLNDGAQRLKVREQQQEPADATASSKALVRLAGYSMQSDSNDIQVTATTYMTMMVHETDQPMAVSLLQSFLCPVLVTFPSQVRVLFDKQKLWRGMQTLSALFR